jgi:hypothetical protein
MITEGCARLCADRNRRDYPEAAKRSHLDLANTPFAHLFQKWIASAPAATLETTLHHLSGSLNCCSGDLSVSLE